MAKVSHASGIEVAATALARLKLEKAGIVLALLSPAVLIVPNFPTPC